MRTFALTLFLAIFSLSMVSGPAHAKKFGGGASLGKSYSAPSTNKFGSTQQKQSTTPTQQKQNAAANTGTKRSGFGGLMAGLLGAGLLGALFFGGAFEGIELMDILILVGIVFVAFKLIGSFKRSQQGSQQGYATSPAGASYTDANANNQTSDNQAQYKQSAPEMFGSQSQPEASMGASEPMGHALQLPEWFNKDAFVAGAQQHYIKLQHAWDVSDWNEIQSYTTPELFELLKVERAKLPEQQTTEVVSVMAELVDFIDNQDHVVVTMSFYGWIKEDGVNTVEFNELWHLRKDMPTPNDTAAPWYIEGIQPQ